jgi:hypothetical protein
MLQLIKPLRAVGRSLNAQQERRERISFLAKVKEAEPAENAYHEDGYNFEHGVGSGAVQRIMRGARGTTSLRKTPSAHSIANTPSRTANQPSTSIILSLWGRR